MSSNLATPTNKIKSITDSLPVNCLGFVSLLSLQSPSGSPVENVPGYRRTTSESYFTLGEGLRQVGTDGINRSNGNVGHYRSNGSGVEKPGEQQSVIRGKPTASDAARELGVSVKTLNGWVKRWVAEGVLTEPPTFKDGLRTVRGFPRDYVAKLQALRDNHRPHPSDGVDNPQNPVNASRGAGDED